MKKLFLAFALWLLAAPAFAQNNTCITRPPSDSTNACASTDFVHSVTSNISALLDILGNSWGDILFRGASGWTVLAPGTNGQFLQTNGAGANPSWAPGAAVGPGTTGYVPIFTSSSTIGNSVIQQAGNGLLIPGNYIDIREKGAACDGTTDDTSAINAGLIAATSSGGGYVVVPSGFTCAFASTINLQDKTVLKIMPNATLKFTGTGGDEINGTNTTCCDNRQNIEGPGLIDATNATSGIVIHYQGGTYDYVHDVYIKTNSTNITAVVINGSSLTGGAGNWRLSKIDGLHVSGTVSDVLDLVGNAVSGPTNNAFYNIDTQISNVHGNCIYAPRDNDTEYFFNLNCEMASGGNGIVIGAATGFGFTVIGFIYNNTTGKTTVVVSGIPSAQELQVNDSIALALTGTGVSWANGPQWLVTNITYQVTQTSIDFQAPAGEGTPLATGGTEATVNTDAWGYQFVNYITSGGNYSVVLYQSTFDSFIGGNDAQGSVNNGINNLNGPAQGVLSIPANYFACHTTIDSNNGYLCTEHMPYKVSQLPALTGNDQGARAYVIDATSCSYGGAPSGGGSSVCAVFFNGASWAMQ